MAQRKCQGFAGIENGCGYIINDLSLVVVSDDDASTASGLAPAEEFPISTSNFDQETSAH